MFFGEDSSWFWSMCQFIVISITLYLIYKQVRIQLKSNMLQTLHKCDDKWSGDTIVNCRKHTAEHFINNNLHLHEQEFILINFFEDIGLYLKEGILAKEIVWNTYSYYIEKYWPILKSAIEERRANDNDKSIAHNFEHLYDSMLSISKKKNAPTRPHTREQLIVFANHEKAL